ncbi:hypothetical protein LAD12857_25820 [Lacrimispora amygdalina]|uniref:Uncharacterized protein n=1 Tax=Lacrimispora amygdalina TaxID=253257 RepID=A0A3E2N462_9FIRM|nr:hypothetical protein [Clostridium indicum]RFZ75766.1 hypothetical protein DS742_27280 [Clostridium indicum]
MKKLIKVFAAASLLSISVASTAMAGTWKQDSEGWRWKEDDHTYTASAWKWIDSDKDGMAECYYFDGDGILLTDTVTPDGHTVNENGAWTDDGIVRLRAANPSAAVQMKKKGALLYQDADRKSSSLPGLDVNADITMDLYYDWLQIPVIMNMQMKYHDINTPNMEFLSSSIIKTLGLEKSESSFYTNGCYYSDSGDSEKFKMKIGYEDMTKHLTLGGLTGQFGAFLDNVQIAQDKDGNSVLFYSSETNGLEQYLNRFYDKVWPSLTDSDFKITGVNGKAVISPEGYFSKEEILISMIITEDEESMGLDMNVNLDYKNPGQAVTITFPSTDGYEEIVY